MSEYGVLPTGFRPKPLARTLSDIEDANASPGAFGSKVVQTPQSPMGVWNGLRADAATELWELAADVYGSYDPDQGEGVSLDRIARLRHLSRLDNEDDVDFARSITNAGTARVRDADFARAVASIEGVTWSRIITNETGFDVEDGLPANAVTVAALGGDDAEVALAARQYLALGITQHGNTAVETVVDGFCRTLAITRPVEVPMRLSVLVKRSAGADGCPPPAPVVIAEAIHAALSGDARPPNGHDMSAHLVRVAMASLPSVEAIRIDIGRVGGDLSTDDAPIGFYEIAAFELANIVVTDAPA